MPRPRTCAVAVAALAVTATALAAGPQTKPDTPDAEQTSPPTRTVRPARTPAPPQLDRRRFDRQDRVGPARRRRESAVYDHRPLLAQLPLERAGVQIDIAGLAPDGSTLLAITHHGRSRSHARAVYRRALTTHADSGRAYTPAYQP